MKLFYLRLLIFKLLILNCLLISANENFSPNANNYLPDSINKFKLSSVIGTTTALYVGSMAYLQYIWYKDHDPVPFTFYNDLAGYNQIDKCGHLYGSYIESYIGFHSLVWAGVPRNKAIWFGGTLGIILQLPIEIWDGMYEGWGFSWSDIGANSLGSALLIAQELAFHEQIFKYKFTFSHSPYAPQANGYLGNGFNELFYDYNGHSYWLSFGINKFFPSSKIPPWMNLSLGYSAGGMYGEFTNKTRYRGVEIPETERYRQFLLSFDIDFSKIPTKNKFLKNLFNNMFLIKIPFPTLEINTKGNIKFYPIYY